MLSYVSVSKELTSLLCWMFQSMNSICLSSYLNLLWVLSFAWCSSHHTSPERVLLGLCLILLFCWVIISGILFLTVLSTCSFLGDRNTTDFFTCFGCTIYGVWDVSSLTKDWTGAQKWKHRAVTTGQGSPWCRWFLRDVNGGVAAWKETAENQGRSTSLRAPRGSTRMRFSVCTGQPACLQAAEGSLGLVTAAHSSSLTPAQHPGIPSSLCADHTCLVNTQKLHLNWRKRRPQDRLFWGQDAAGPAVIEGPRENTFFR